MSRTSIPKIFMAGGAVGFTYYLFMRQYWFPNPYNSIGVNNTEDRFSAGGGKPNPNYKPQTAEKGSQNTETNQTGSTDTNINAQKGGGE